MSEKFPCPEGYEEIKLPFNIGTQRPFYSKPDNIKGVFLKLFQHSKDKKLFGYVEFGEMIEGPPGHAHGGAIAYVLDESMGTSVWCAGYKVVAEEITVRFKKMIRHNDTLLIECQVIEEKKGRIITEGFIKDESGAVYAQGLGVFHELNENQLNAISERIKNSV